MSHVMHRHFMVYLRAQLQVGHLGLVNLIRPKAKEMSWFGCHFILYSTKTYDFNNSCIIFLRSNIPHIISRPKK